MLLRPEKLTQHSRNISTATCCASKAVHMLEAGINIIYIRDFLGHEDISTTMVYIKADNHLKNEAISKLAPKVIQEKDLPDWSKDTELMDFLNSLG